MNVTALPTASPAAFYRRHNTFPRFQGTARPVHRLGATNGADRLHTTARQDLPQPPDPGLLLADLTSPWAYLAHLRLERRDPDTQARPSWCAVQAVTGRPRAGLRGGGADRDRVRQELEAVQALALDGEEVPEEVPAVLPHPRPVAAAYAEAVDLGRGTQVRALLLRAYWVEGRDIGDPEVLRRLLPSALVDDGAVCTGDPRREWGYVVSSSRGPLSDGAYHLMRRWQQHWERLGSPGPLVRVGPDGTTTGVAALRSRVPSAAR